MGCESTLLESTYSLLRRRRQELTLRQIATGARVKYDWLSKFANGQIPNPGIVNVQSLHDFLSGKQRAA